MDGDARIVVRTIGMIVFTDALNDRIDLDRVAMLRAPGQGAADIVAGPGAVRRFICWWRIRLTLTKSWSRT